MHEYTIEDTFQITGRGLVVLVNATNNYPPGKMLEVVIKDSSNQEVARDQAIQEWVRKLRDDSSVESIAFCLLSIQKHQIPDNGKIVILDEGSIWQNGVQRQ